MEAQMEFQQKYEIASRKRCIIPEKPEILEAEQALAQDPRNGDLWMQKGLALAKYSLMREATECYSMAISYNPFKWEYYRHRAHRFLSMWRFEDAAADFTIASRLNPDGWDIWYHLGLSHFLLGAYDKAAKAYQRCLDLTTQESKLIACVDWYWMTLNRLERYDDAKKLLDRITTGMDAGDNTAYYARLMVYKGLKKAEDVLSADPEKTTDLERLTYGFGIGNYMMIHGDAQSAIDIWKQVVKAGDENDLYYAFSYLASKVELTRRGLL